VAEGVSAEGLAVDGQSPQQQAQWYLGRQDGMDIISGLEIVTGSR